MNKSFQSKIQNPKSKILLLDWIRGGRWLVALLSSFENFESAGLAVMEIPETGRGTPDGEIRLFYHRRNPRAAGYRLPRPSGRPEASDRCSVGRKNCLPNFS